MTSPVSDSVPESGGFSGNREESAEPVVACRICGSGTKDAGQKTGTYSGRSFHFRQCLTCHHSFVADPWLDYAAIYDERYYRGQGADPYVDYYFELEHPEQTVRCHEWDGVIAAIASLRPLNAETCWLDFGCGHGGQVRHAASRVGCQVAGFDTGEIVTAARAKGVKILEEAELSSLDGKCDVVTAIEVLEHLPDPLAALRRIRALLKPGGLFFYTTGNARPFRDQITSWDYTIPEIHVSFVEPLTMEHALRATGFRPEVRLSLPGFERIIRFKILKRLGIRRRSWAENLLPWPIIVPLLRRKLGIGDLPIGWAQ